MKRTKIPINGTNQIMKRTKSQVDGNNAQNVPVFRKILHKWTLGVATIQFFPHPFFADFRHGKEIIICQISQVRLVQGASEDLLAKRNDSSDLVDRTEKSDEIPEKKNT